MPIELRAQKRSKIDIPGWEIAVGVKFYFPLLLWSDFCASLLTSNSYTVDYPGKDFRSTILEKMQFSPFDREMLF